MKGAPLLIAALCIVLALSSSQCSGLVHTAEPLPVGQLLSREGMSSGRQLLASSQSKQDLEDEILQEEMTALELEELAEEEEEIAEAEVDEALSLDTERVTKEGSGGFLSTSSWPTFGLVGEKQAALYYGVCLLFTVFFFKNSGIRHSLMGIARANSHGKSARLGA